MDGRRILSFQDAKQTGGFPQTDNGLSVTGPRSSVSIQCAASFRTTQCEASLEHSGTPVAQRTRLEERFAESATRRG